MKKLMLASALALATFSACAKDQVIALSDADAAALQNKTIALTTHELPDFVAASAGKMAFGLFGVGAAIKAGNDLVKDNQIGDPAEIVRTNLSAALHDAYGAQVLAADTSTTKSEKPKDLAALHAQADYVLDIRSSGWKTSYFATQWGKYWVGYGVRAQLIDTKTARVLANAGCTATTIQNPGKPTDDQLKADHAKLLKDTLSALGWMCTETLAKNVLHVPADKIAAIPAEYVNPLASLAPAAQSTTPQIPASPTPAASQAAPATQDTRTHNGSR